MPEDEKQHVRKQKLGLNIFSNVAQYLIINAVMLKMDKQVNRNTLIAVAIPFLINLFIDIFARTPYYQTFKEKFLPEDPDYVRALRRKPENEDKQPAFNVNKVELDKTTLKQLQNNNINSNVSFGVSYTTVHLLGKLLGKLKGAGVQTYDVYSAAEQLDMPEEEVRKATLLKFLRELSSQLLENVIYFTVLIKMKKRLDKSLAMAVFVPVLLSIGLDVLSRSKAFDFLKNWTKKIVDLSGGKEIKTNRDKEKEQYSSRYSKVIEI